MQTGHAAGARIMTSAAAETVDAFHRGKFHVVQPLGQGHRSGMDAMLLASLVSADRPCRVADLGAGAGAAGMAVASRIEGAEVVLVERSPIMAEVKRRADVVGIFPNEDSIVRLVGAVLLEQNDEWQLQHRYMQVEGMTALATPQIEEVAQLQITPKAA